MASENTSYYSLEELPTRHRTGRALLISAIVCVVLSVAYIQGWRYIVANPVASLAQIAQNVTCTGTSICLPIGVGQQLGYVSYRWGFLPSYSSDLGSLMFYHFLFFLIILPVTGLLTFIAGYAKWVIT